MLSFRKKTLAGAALCGTRGLMHFQRGNAIGCALDHLARGQQAILGQPTAGTGSTR
jgi:hypothetical protein